MVRRGLETRYSTPGRRLVGRLFAKSYSPIPNVCCASDLVSGIGHTRFLAGDSRTYSTGSSPSGSAKRMAIIRPKTTTRNPSPIPNTRQCECFWPPALQ